MAIFRKKTKKRSISVGKLKSTAKLLLFSETTKFFQKKNVFCLDYCLLAVQMQGYSMFFQAYKQS